MSDPTLNDNLSAYLDGELTPAEAAELAARLRTDPALQAELDALREAVELLRAHGPVQAPAHLHGAILTAVAREPAPGGVLAFLRRPLGLPIQGLAVAAVALVIIGIALSTGTEIGFRPAVFGVGPASERPVEPGAVDPQIQAPRADARQAGNSPGKGTAASSGNSPVNPAAAPADRSSTGPAADGDDLAAGVADEEGDAAPIADGQAVAQASGLPPGKGGGPELYGGISMHTIALRERDLPAVARLLQKHGALDVQGRDPASRVASLEGGEHQLALRLPDPARRNAFVADLRRTFSGAHTERVIEDGSLSLAGAQVALKLVVTPYIPAATPEP